MRIARTPSVALVLVAWAAAVHSQTPAPAEPAGPVYDVVSVRPATGTAQFIGLVQRPDGGLTASNVPVATLIARAYPPAIPAEFVGLPDWATSERFDVTATSTRSNITAAARIAMLRAMLADRFRLAVHVEPRARDVYELVPARSDGRLGSGLTPIKTDCVAVRAAARAARDAGAPPPPPEPPRILPPLTPGGPPRMVAPGPAPSCVLRVFSENLDGQGSIADLSAFIRAFAGREVLDKSGLTGFYQITMRFDQMATRRPPEAVADPDAGPTIFAAVQQQLGMKLVPARVDRETLVIDRLERPTEN